MEVKITIEYNWHCDQEIDIPEQHKEALEEDAMTIIYEMLKDDYVAGELITSVRMGKDKVPEEDEEEGLSYSGWFSIKTERV